MNKNTSCWPLHQQHHKSQSNKKLDYEEDSLNVCFDETAFRSKFPASALLKRDKQDDNKIQFNWFLFAQF